MILGGLPAGAVLVRKGHAGKDYERALRKPPRKCRNESCEKYLVGDQRFPYCGRSCASRHAWKARIKPKKKKQMHVQMALPLLDRQRNFENWSKWRGFAAIAKRACGFCQRQYLPKSRQQRIFCGDKCAEKSARKSRPSWTHRKRARRHGAEYEAFNPKKIIESFGAQCFLCRRSAAKFHIDHWVPSVRGGPTIEFNLVCLCETCNIIKGHIVIAAPKELVMRLATPDRKRLQDAIKKAWPWTFSDAGQKEMARWQRRAAKFSNVYEGGHNPWIKAQKAA